MYKFFLTILSLFFSLSVHADEQVIADIFDLGHPVFEPIEKGNQGSSLTVRDIVEDKNGFIWIAGQKGLQRYDGYRYKIYRYDKNDDTSVPSNDIADLLVDKNNNIWVGATYSGFAIFQHDKEAFYKPIFPDNMGALSVYSMTEQPDVGVWIGTDKGLFLVNYQFELIEVIGRSNGEQKSHSFSALSLDSTQALWGVHKNKIFKKEMGHKLEYFHALSDKARPTGSFQDSFGNIWLSTSYEGLFKLSPTGELLQRYDDISAVFIFEPIQGQLWIGSSVSGMQVLDIANDKIIKQYSHDPSIPHSLGMNYVLSAIKDRAGLIWIGTSGEGIYRLNTHNATFANLYHSPRDSRSLSDVDILGAAVLEDGSVMFAPYGKSIDLFDPAVGRVKTYNEETTNNPLLNKVKATTIEEFDDSSVYMSFSGKGIVRFDRNNETFSLVNGFEEVRAYKIHKENENSLLIGSVNGLKRYFPDQQKIEDFYVSKDQTQTNDTTYRFIEPTAQGAFWLGGIKAGNPVGYVEPDTNIVHTVNVISDDYDIADRVLGVTIDSQDNVYITTRKGFFKFVNWISKNETYKAAFELQPLSDTTAGILFEGLGNTLWGSSYVVNRNDGSVESFSITDGIGIKPLWYMSRHKTAEGAFLFGGGNGVLMARPDRYKAWQYNPPLVVTDVYQDGEPWLLQGNSMDVTPDISKFSVEFAALDFSNPVALQYAYSLKGYANDKWFNVDADHRVATFTNLAPGNYQLQIKGTNRKGAWSENELSIDINVLPAWYQTWWFRVLVMICIMSSLYGFYYLRVRQMKAKRKELEAVVAERTFSLEEKSKALALKSEALEAQTVVLKQKSHSLEIKTQEATQALQQLVATQGQLVESEKHASLGRLVVGVSHELNTPLGIAKVAVDQMLHDAQALSDMMTSGKLSKSVFMKKNQSISDASDMASTSINRAADLVARFKALSTEQSKTERKGVELVQHLRDIVSAIEFETSSMKGRLHIKANQPISLHTDPDAFRKIIESLFENAMQHAFFDSIETARIDIQLNKEADEGGETIVITFTDNGCGIHQDELPHIFDPFYTSARDAGAVGLGLHMVFNIVTRSLLGTIECVSAQGKGTQFIMCVPINPQSQGPLLPEVPADNDNVIFD